MSSNLRKQNGQFVIEAVLLMMIATGIIISATKILRDQKFLSNLVSNPWTLIAGMSESGVWLPANEARNHHPNTWARVRTPDPSK